MTITVHFDDFHIEEYGSTRDAQDAILEAHAEGVGVDVVHDGSCVDGEVDDCYEKQYSCIWTVLLQKEWRD